MYLTNAAFVNTGALTELAVNPEFNADGTPKPIFLIGPNGTGKTNFLSSIADALHEIAAQHFADILKKDGLSHNFFRILGGSTTKVGAAFELTGMKFSHQAHNFFYLSKSGNLPPSPPLPIASFLEGITWPAEGASKQVTGSTSEIEKIFRAGSYAFFPADRNEIPYWLNAPENFQAVQASFVDRYQDRLMKPLVVRSPLSDFQQWLVNIFLDATVDPSVVVNGTDLNVVKQQTIERILTIGPSIAAINQVISAIFQKPGSRITRTVRTMGQRKIQVSSQDGAVLVESLRGLSSGQSSLLSIFGTILRYGDVPGRPITQIEGIALIDEIDAHLHSDLQHDVLPSLIKLFPKVQFIASCHSPLAALGLQRAFGDDGCVLIELPTGRKIDAERFQEFEKSLRYYRSTKSFEDEVALKASASGRPLVICEGETDPIYLKAAAELLGFDALVQGVTFDWVGTKLEVGSEGGGKSALDAAFRFLKNNPDFIHSPIVILYDCDTGKPKLDIGKLHVRAFAKIDTNMECQSGIENLLPSEVFETRFYDTKRKITADRHVTEILKKTELCQYLCTQVRNPAHFEAFRPFLQELSALFGS